MKKGNSGYYLVVLAGLAMLLVAGYYFYDAYMVSPEQKIMQSLERLRAGGEKKSVRAILAEVSARYQDAVNPDKKALNDNVRYWSGVNLSNPVTVTYKDVGVLIAADSKTAVARLTVQGNQPVQDVLKMLHPSGEIEVLYANEDGVWRIVMVKAR